MPPTDLKTKRIRRIRSLAAKQLSSVLGRQVQQADVTFITSHNKGYAWFLAETKIDPTTGDEVITEYDLPGWTKNQIHRWKVDESSEMLMWLNKGFLKAEKLEEDQDEEGTKIKGSKEKAEPRRYFFEEVRIVVLNEREEKAKRNKWIQPLATIKGPASNFVAWMTGAVDEATNKRMKKKYKIKQERAEDGEGVSDVSDSSQGSDSENTSVGSEQHAVDMIVPSLRDIYKTNK
ncbi:hypothetical protein ABW20_dc0110028 [Dactylellina cionopaga]|nr:hypothetical protein ABW20_dc0110028 [Dactylellina cionopaga]